jgi:Rrf2 family cysteine metabolism transcriptional repressor
MRLSSRTEYAILALIFLARLKDDQFAHGQDISTKQNIPMSFLQQILFSLKQARLVRSIKGKAGGYALSRKPSTISIAEVVRLFDGPLAPSKAVSLFFYEETPISKEKKMTRVLKEIRDHVAKKLESTFLSDII